MEEGYGALASDGTVLAILNGAAKAYESQVVMALNSSPFQRVELLSEPAAWNPRKQILHIYIVTYLGVLTVFHQNGLSYLVTAFRPIPWKGIGKPRNSDIVREAVRKVRMRKLMVWYEDKKRQAAGNSMSPEIEELSEVVGDAVTTECGNEEYFVSLILHGEYLRRITQGAETVDETQLALLRDYDNWLKINAKYAPDLSRLQEHVEGLLVKLEQFASLSESSREAVDGEELVAQLDEAMCIASVGIRIDVYARTTIEEMSEKVNTQFEKVAPSLGDLWEFSSRFLAAFPPDRDCLSLYAFWRSGTRFAPSDVQLELARKHMSAQERSRIIDNAVERFRKTAVLERLLERFDGIREWIVTTLSEPDSVPAPAVGYSVAEEGPVFSPPLYSDDVISVVIDSDTLEVQVAEEYSFEVQSVRNSMGDSLDFQLSSRERFLRVSLEQLAKEHELKIVLIIDDTIVELPRIQWEAKR